VNLHFLVIFAPGVTATLMSLLGIAPSYAVAVLLLVAAGISSAAFHAVGPAIAGRLSGPRLGQGMSLWMVGSEFGRTIAPLVIVGAIQVLTLQGTPWLMVIGFVGTVVLYLGLRDVPETPADALGGVAWWRALNRMGPTMIPLLGIVLARSFPRAALTTFLPTLVREEGGSLWFAGITLTVFEAAGTIGTLFGGPISDRVGRRRILAFTMITVPPLMFLFLAAEGWVRLGVLVATGFIALSVTPVTMALVQETFPENRALANGLYGGMAFALRSLVTVALGMIGDALGLRQAFAVSAIVYLLGTPLLLLLPEGNRSGS
jgi:FSR family fosmidomycin resistance protein-like MFS transporter